MTPTRIVVLGGGFGGVEATRVLERGLRRREEVDLLLVSDQNYLLFTPLLPQIASSTVEPRHIIQPIRDIRARRRFRFLRDRVLGLDLKERRVHLVEEDVPYDFLVVALGGLTQTFGIPGVEEHAFFFKGLEDAVVLRDQVIDFAEHAAHERESVRRRELLTVCVVGGGYTGVELIAEFYDFFTRYVVPRYRGIELGDLRLILLEASGEILSGVHPILARRARRKLERQGIEVLTEAKATRVLATGVEINGGRIERAGLVVWVTGVAGHPVFAGLGLPTDRTGRVIVSQFLELPGFPEVFGVGDTVAVAGHPEASIPIIPAAIAHGRLAAENILNRLEGRPPVPVEFSPRGMLVSLGMNDAVVDLMGLKFSGYPAWLFWTALHLYRLVGFRKQLQVMLDWTLTHVFPRDSAIIRRPLRCPICTGKLPLTLPQGGEDNGEGGRNGEPA